MLSLSSQFAAAATEAEQVIFLASGQAMMAQYTGTAFDVYYVFNAVGLLIMAVVMLRSDIFSKGTAYWGIAAGGLMIIPSSAGMIGMAFALASLVPWMVFAILIARRFFQLGRE